MGAGEMLSSFKMRDRVFRVELRDAEVEIVTSSVDVTGWCVIGGGATSLTSEPSLIITCLILSLSKTCLLALGMSALDGLSSGLHAHHRVKKNSDSLPILVGKF